MFYLGFLTLEPIFLVKYNENGALGSLWEATGVPRRPPGSPGRPRKGQLLIIIFLEINDIRAWLAGALKWSVSDDN